MGFLVVSLNGCNMWNERKTDAVIEIDLTQTGKTLNTDMYGITFPKINHAVDTGLYAELIENPDFVDNNVTKVVKNNNNLSGLQANLEKLLVGLKPSYLQFPQGCIVEGATLQSRFQWNISKVDNSKHPDPKYVNNNACKVYIEAFAETKGKPGTGNLKSALVEAAIMILKEGNLDETKTDSRGVSIENNNEMKWNPGMIIYNSTQAYGTPSYYAIKMFSDNRPDKVMPTTLTMNATGNAGPKVLPDKDKKLIHNDTLKEKYKPTVYATAGVQEKAGLVIIKIVNMFNKTKVCKVVLNYKQQIKYKGEAYVMTSGSMMDENSFKELEKVVPMTKELKGLKHTFKYECPANSIVIIKLRYKKGVAGNGSCC